MKKIVIFICLCGFFVPFAFSQNDEEYTCRDFSKKIEINTFSSYGKSEVEKLFFEEINALLEFFHDPSPEAAYIPFRGLRIVKDSSNSYILEIKYVANYATALKEAGNIIENALKYYRIKTVAFPVSKLFVDKLFTKTVSFIVNFKGKETSSFTFDGYASIFRTVVRNEVWSLRVNGPMGYALKMSDFFMQIMRDANTNSFNESKYIEQLDKIKTNP